MHTFSLSGQFIDLFQLETYPAVVTITSGKIERVERVETAPNQFILPGFVDAHIHIESSMLLPVAFGAAAVVHGTVATVSDPHEIANVCGMEGVRYMIANSKLTPFKIFFGAPSCVPATAFETAGATLGADAVAELLQNSDIWYLSEMMNYPGVLHRDPEVMAKIEAAHKVGKPVDGHAPGLKGELAANYASAGITTDHECFTLDEAIGKVAAGMHILIREGSAARNFEALHPLLSLHPDKVMFCSDDKHPDELVLHHINNLVKRALQKGHDFYDVLRAACVNPVLHYNIPVGLLREGDDADFIVIDNPDDFNILKTFIKGQLVSENGQTLLQQVAAEPINQFHALPKKAMEFQITSVSPSPTVKVIEALEGQLVTNELLLPGKVTDGKLVSDTSRDILKLVVVNRYATDAPPAIAFIKNFGLKTGAIASTIGHDCHNIIAVGVDDDAICLAVNALIDCKGGISVTGANQQADVLPLPVAGLMSTASAHEVAAAYTRIDQKAKALGTTLHAPFMTLSFMALLVIPALKLSDKGLFDGSKFEFVGVEV